jgi:hypothetical protein
MNLQKEKATENIPDEVKLLSKKADDLSDRQSNIFDSDLGDEDIDPIIDFDLISDIANPPKSYRLSYRIRRLLIDNLPKGKENKKLRQYIYDEKNLFLKEGLEVGADGRQAYIANFLEKAFKIVANWILSGATPYDIFIQFRDLNTERGYYGNKNLSSFDKTIKQALDYDPKKE